MKQETSDPVYNTLGNSYDGPRCADPELTKIICDIFTGSLQSKILDIACGTGNYTIALAKHGFTMTGVDISKIMLDQARMKHPETKWLESGEEHLPLEDNTYRGALCSFAIQHLSHPQNTFNEAYRVINKGPLVIFTTTPEQMKHFWLWHYFPQMMETGSEVMSSSKTIIELMTQAGFSNIKERLFFVTENTQDMFLHAAKYKPQAYLDAAVRHAISTFALYANKQELQEGLAQLEQDIQNGSIKSIIERYESDLGDYSFFIGEKS